MWGFCACMGAGCELDCNDCSSSEKPALVAFHSVYEEDMESSRPALPVVAHVSRPSGDRLGESPLPNEKTPARTREDLLVFPILPEDDLQNFGSSIPREASCMDNAAVSSKGVCRSRQEDCTEAVQLPALPFDAACTDPRPTSGRQFSKQPAPPLRDKPLAADFSRRGSRSTPRVEDSVEMLSMTFQLEAGRPLAMHCAAVANPPPCGTLVVTSVQKDCLLLWTSDGAPGVCVGDVIMVVDGVSESAGKMLERLQQVRDAGGALNMFVRPRPRFFNVRVARKGNEPLGVTVYYDENRAERLAVEEVGTSGAVPQWNDLQPGVRLVPDDRIVAMNGVAKPADELMMDLHKSWHVKEAITLRIETAPRHGVPSG
eukprot:TRINITY_DN101262_c0_g1_i1.p1 TRINITY_DN101262_c0_g1~~TRINITY_DN101262_c0_g1_i1.p1  ORF type:complete len:372 (-),score=46.26 TRINITY_DN101262_c0_g1_i1:47-1162(-)